MTKFSAVLVAFGGRSEMQNQIPNSISGEGNALNWSELLRIASEAPSPDDPVAWARYLMTSEAFWCVPVVGKNPAIAGGLKRATNNPDEFARQFFKVTATGFGVHLGRSHLVVFDLDSSEDYPLDVLEDAIESWFRIQGGRTKTLVVRTGRMRGGRHYYFRLPNGTTLPSTKTFLGLPIEIRTGEQIVVGPASLHPTGLRYEPIEWEAISELPHSIVQALKESIEVPEHAPNSRSSANPKGWMDRLLQNGLRVGERDDGFFRLACAFRQRGVDESTARMMIEKVWRLSDNPPDDRIELREVFGKLRRVYDKYDGPENVEPRLVDLARRWHSELLSDGTTNHEQRHSWMPVDIGPALRGEIVGSLPKLLLRTDGAPLLYTGSLNLLIGEPECGKTWVALMAAAEILSSGGVVEYLDFENGPLPLVERLRLLGISDDIILRNFIYVAPDDPFGASEQREVLETIKRHNVQLVIVDAIAEAMNLADLNPYDNPDVAEWYAILAKKMVAVGATVIALDHVTKNKEGRGRWAIGGQHKLAGLDGTALTFANLSPFGRETVGYSNVSLAKDRHGHVRKYAEANGAVAKLRISSGIDGAFEITLETPQFVDLAFESRRYEEGLGSLFKMAEQISRFIENAQTPPNKGQAKDAIRGNKRVKDHALEYLIDNGYVEEQAGVGTAKLLTSLRQFRFAS